MQTQGLRFSQQQSFAVAYNKKYKEGKDRDPQTLFQTGEDGRQKSLSNAVSHINNLHNGQIMSLLST